MTTPEEYTTENCTAMGTAQPRNFAKLPKVKYFRVQSRGAVGTLKDRQERKVGAWAVLVAIEGGNGLRLASDVAFEHGMTFKCEFATKDDAFKAAMDFKAKWGVPTSKTAKAKDEAVGKAKDEVISKMREGLIGMGMKAEMVEVIIQNLNK